MAYSKKIFDIATEKLNLRRNSALNMVEYRKKELYSSFPRLNEIEKNLGEIGAQTAKAVLNGKNALEEMKLLKEKSTALQKEYKAILTDNGYAEDYLEPHFSCEKCNDTGYVELENKTVTCDCYKKLLSNTACEELNKISPLSLSTFDSFNLNYYSDKPDENGKIPYNRMVKILKHCSDYAYNFSPSSKGLLMMGSTGLGKTHLSLAIANEVINRGYSVVYVSAPDILAKLEREHFAYGYSNEEQTMKSLIDCDLLILDDLGTEFVTQFTSTTIYNIFNSRINSGKPIIINTNLSVDELGKIYTRRFTSRLNSSCEQLEFIGRDIRALL